MDVDLLREVMRGAVGVAFEGEHSVGISLIDGLNHHPIRIHVIEMETIATFDGGENGLIFAQGVIHPQSFDIDAVIKDHRADVLCPPTVR